MAPNIDWQSLKIRQGTLLPHWSCDHAVYHVVFRLLDSIPISTLRKWAREREAIIENACQIGRPLSKYEIDRLGILYSEKVDEYLNAGHGQCWLKHPEIADVISAAIVYSNGDRYNLHAWCVMPSHVHVIVEPLGNHELSDIVQSWKSFSAQQANRFLNRRGGFWHREFYDRIIRSNREYRHQIEYVKQNPLKAGLKNWRWQHVAEETK